MLKLISLLAFLLISPFLFAQQNESNGPQRYYLNKDYYIVKNSSEAQYYVVINWKDGKIMNPTTDYFLNGKKHWEGDVLTCDAVNNVYVMNGLCTWFDEEGNKEFQVTMSSNAWNGRFLSWWPNGSVKEETNYTNGNQTGCIFRWNEKGHCISDNKSNCECIDLTPTKAYADIMGVGYNIDLFFKGASNQYCYLVHYYGKGLPTIYKRDSVLLDRVGHGRFYSDDVSFVGGIYMMLLDDHKTNFEFLLNAGDNITINASMPTGLDQPVSLSFKNSDQNTRFLDYIAFLKKYSARQNDLTKELSIAKSADDTVYVRRKGSELSKELTNYRRDYVAKYPNTLLSAIFNAMETPEVPAGIHYLEDGQTEDQYFAYHYYKQHYWDYYDFQDDRLIHTPLLDSKLEEYISKETYQNPDSVEHEADYILNLANGTKDNFKYCLWWITRYVENSKVMGMDKAFIYLVENYYMKGAAFWLTDEELQKYINRAKKMR